MAKQYALQSAFNAGEWTDRLLGQVKLNKYRDACRVLENFLVHAHGPAFVRPGFKFVAQLQSSLYPGRLAPFVFSNIQSYMMVLEIQLAWFIANEDPLLDGSNNLVQVVTPYQVTNPLNNFLSDLPYIKFAQSFDVQYWVHPLYPVYKMERLSDTLFSFLAVPFNDGPYMNQNSDMMLYVQVTAPSGGVTPGASAAGYITVSNFEGLQIVTAVKTNGGSDYTSGVNISTAVGSGVTFTPHVVNGVIKSIGTSGYGTGYVNNAPLIFTNSGSGSGGAFSIGQSVTLSALYRGNLQSIGSWNDAATTAQTAFSSALPVIGFQFTPVFGIQTNAVQLNIVAAPASAMNVTASIYADVAGSPGGTVLDTSDVQDLHANGVGTTTWTFTGAANLNVGAKYWVVFVSAAPQSGVTIGAVTAVAGGPDLSYGSGGATTIAGITNSMAVTWQVLQSVTPAGLGALFQPGHVGAIWRVMQTGQTIKKTFTATGQVSAAILLRGQFQVDTTPITPPSGGSYWIGTIVLESSADLIYWEAVATFFYSTTQSFVESRTGIYYRLRCTLYSSGSGNTGQISQTEQWGTILITSYTSPSSVQGTVLFPPASSDPTPNWCEGAWSNYRGFPAVTLFHDDRLWFFRDEFIWGSWVGDYENFNPDGDTADAAITFSPTQLMNPIAWAKSLRGIMLGSIGEEGQISGGAGDARTPITPTSVMCEIQSSHGSAQYPDPIEVGQAVLFLQVAKRKIREFVYNLADDGFKSPDLTIRAADITVGGIVDMDFQEEPYSTLYTVRADGVMPALVYQRDEDVVAWSRITTQGNFESVACIMRSTGINEGYDEAYAIVSRMINGNLVRFVEVQAYNEPISSIQQTAASYTLLDCCTVFTQPESVFPPSLWGTTLTGLDYLDGMAVTVVRDGLVLPDTYLVSGGQIEIDMPFVTSCVVGLPYTATLTTMPLELVDRAGTTLGRQKLGFQLFMRLLNSLGGSVGPDVNNLQEIQYGPVLADEQMPLFSGIKRIPYTDNTDDISITIQSTPGLPLTVAALGLECDVND